jgi:hypothetical protein
MTKRVQKNSDGKYHVKGRKYNQLVGSRAEVWHGTAYKTCYGKHCLTRADMLQNKHGRLVSRKKHNTAKREKRLEKHGYFAKKGKFGYVRKDHTFHKKNHKSKRKTSKNRK